MHKIRKVILSMTVAAFGAMGAYAQIAGNSLPNVNAGDLMLGFQNSNSSNDLIFDIGPFTSYENAIGTQLVAGFNSADLINTFGSNSTNGGYSAQTQWTVLGSSGLGNFLTNGTRDIPDGVIWVTTGSAVFAPRTTTVPQMALSNRIDLFVEESGPSAFQTGSLISGGTLSNSNAESMTLEISPQNAMGGYFAHPVETSAAGTSTMFLYELNPTLPANTIGQELGFFTLNSSSQTLSFTAVPEASTYAAIVGTMALAVAAIFRSTTTRRKTGTVPKQL